MNGQSHETLKGTTKGAARPGISGVSGVSGMSSFSNNSTPPTFPIPSPFAASTYMSLVFWLIVVNVAIYGWMSTLPAEACRSIHFLYGISRTGLENGDVWQFLTYGFIHGGWKHLALNMLGLFFFGRPVEKMLGGWRFVLLYFLALIGGAVGQLLIAPSGQHLIGASGAVFGVILAFSTIYYDRKVIVLLFFVLPLPLRARYLGWLVFGFSLVMVVMHWDAGIGHAAHLAGCVVGYLYARALGYGPRSWIERLVGRLGRV